MEFMAERKEAAANTNKDMERRFRPIAPKPSLLPPPLMMPIGNMASSMLWQPRKRGRQDHLLMSPMPKRERDMMSYPPTPVMPAASHGVIPMVMGGWCMQEGLLPNCEEHLQRLLLTGSSTSPSAQLLDERKSLPMERDLISKLQVPKVIKPRAIRPLFTTICIDSSNISYAYSAVAITVSKKTKKEVETELELPNALPAIVSGKHNHVHLANEAYKVMVGQPVCPWLDSVTGTSASRRINGMVMLHVQTFNHMTHSLNTSGGAFPCTARISWETNVAIASLTVPCAIEHLVGNSGDYLFIWRFDSSRASIIYCIP